MTNPLYCRHPIPPSASPRGPHAHHAGGNAAPHLLHRHGRHRARICASGAGHDGHHPMDHGRSERGEHGHPEHRGRRGGGGRGGDGGSRRPLGRGDLRLLLLAQIEQQPCHGYELIQLIADRFNGAYVPSPGVIYPTLALLEDLGWIAADEANGRKRYSITDAGRTQADADRDAIDAAQTRTRDSARQMAKDALPAPVREAMHHLRDALIQRQGSWTDAEAARVTLLLSQAVDSIAASADTP